MIYNIKLEDIIGNALDEVLKGIDKDEIESPDGWWETSAGVEFGKQKKEELTKRLNEVIKEWEKS